MKLFRKKGDPTRLIEIAYQLFDELDFEYGICSPKLMAEKRAELDTACNEALGNPKVEYLGQ